MKLNLNQIILVFTLSSTSLLSSFSLVVAQSIPTQPSQPTSPQPPKSGTIKVDLPNLPPGPAPGGRRFGGARRGSCPHVKPPLTALVPLTEQPASVTNVWGLTTEAHPQLWFYLPYTKSSGYPAEFVLLDDQTKDSVYNSAIALPTKAGIIKVPVPENAPSLQVGKQYRWFLNIYCDPQNQSTPIYVEGVIVRRNPNQSLVKQLQKAQPLQQVAIYAENGFWYDALTTLGQLRQTNPQNRTLQTQWRDLLAAVGLGELTVQPLVQP
ncbi:hypothetical protein CEN39_07305 [Fischerella thermalis CCMEE 5201]|jgi:hypothetical protein|nr:hypothetical protein CEN39_07305 [Fischerella thermalis CCMEE 5201]